MSTGRPTGPGFLHYNREIPEMNRLECEAKGTLWRANVAANARAFSSRRSIAELVGSDRHRSTVAVLAAAGPRLPLAFDAIARHRKSIRLFAVDAAYAPLRAAGLEPDFVFVKNTGPEVGRLLEGGSASRIGLVANLAGDPSVLAAWKGTIFQYLPTCETEGVAALRALLPAAPTITLKQSSATMQLLLAHAMGFRRLLLVGHDFSFTENLIYAPGTRVLEPGYPHERGDDGRIVIRDAFRMQDIFLEPCTTTNELFASCEDLYALVRYNGWDRVYNATNGGILFNLPWIYPEDGITGISAEANRLETIRVDPGNDPVMARSNDATFNLLGPLILRNSLDNRHTVRAHTHVGKLFARREEFSHLPCVIVGAAASVDDNLDTLRRLRDRVKILCVDASIHPLVAAGIRPDFALTIDPQKAVAPFFRGYDTNGIGLIVSICSHPEAISAWEGEMYFYWPLAYSRLVIQVATLFPEVPTLIPLSNCGSTSAILAPSLGFRRTILLGLDFAYTHDRYYCANVLHPHSKLSGKDAIREARPDAEEVVDIHGEVVYTDTILRNYATYLDRTIALDPGRFVNAGAGILRSLPYLPLEQAILAPELPPLPGVEKNPS